MSAAQRYRVRHETVYDYGGNVAHSHQLLHLTPRNSALQICSARTIEVDPKPSSRSEWPDAFGNLTTRLEYDSPHERLEVVAHVEVEVRAPPPAAAGEAVAWEKAREMLSYSGAPMSAEQLEACRFRMESSYVQIKREFFEYGADCFSAGSATLAGAEALMHKIHRDFVYAPGSTDIRTSSAEAFAARRGVCQDFSHIMIACLRSRGLAARYVSGYLRTLPPPGAPAGWVGHDASHAWVSLYSPPFGWIDLDPTNDVRISTGHIVVAWGRDFGDVSPLRGVIIGGRRHTLSVRVSVQPE